MAPERCGGEHSKMQDLPSADSTSRAGACADNGVAVLIVDDQHAIRHALTQLIAQAPGLTLRAVQAVPTAAQARAAITVLRPEIVLLDVDLAGDDGLLLLPELVPHIQVVVISTEGSPLLRAKALVAGARAFHHKTDPAQRLLAVVALLVGEIRSRGELPPPLAGHDARALGGGSSAVQPGPAA